MKKILLLGAFALLTTTLFSCTADEYETAEEKAEINKPIPVNATAQGPDDDPITVPPPKPKN